MPSRGSSYLESMVLEAIDSAMEALGTTVKESILLYLVKTHSLHKQDIPRDINQFTKTLQDLLGSGARVVEKLVIASLVVKCQIPPHTVQGKTLEAVIEAADRSVNERDLLSEVREGELEDTKHSRRLNASPKA